VLLAELFPFVHELSHNVTQVINGRGRIIFSVALDQFILWPKPLTEMTIVKLSYLLKLTNM
jgi:hypothetical protein